ncbi:plasmolipin-like [Spinachia spinachia]
MADFPSKVTTETSYPNSRSSQPGGSTLRGMAANFPTTMDMSFIRSIRAILMMAEIILGLIQWALIASAPYTLLAAFGWVMFVAVTLWILTTILFFLILFGGEQKLTFVPWRMVVGREEGKEDRGKRKRGQWNYSSLYAGLQGTISLSLCCVFGIRIFSHEIHRINSSKTRQIYCYEGKNGLCPSVQFFGAVVTIAYGASAFFAYLDWKGDGGNAANNTVPT